MRSSRISGERELRGNRPTQVHHWPLAIGCLCERLAAENFSLASCVLVDCKWRDLRYFAAVCQSLYQRLFNFFLMSIWLWCLGFCWCFVLLFSGCIEKYASSTCPVCHVPSYHKDIRPNRQMDLLASLCLRFSMLLPPHHSQPSGQLQLQFVNLLTMINIKHSSLRCSPWLTLNTRHFGAHHD